MGYKNTSSLAYEVERALIGDYNIHSHGDLGAFYRSISNSDLPQYTALFYHPSEHESLSEVRYSRVQIGYDSGLRHFTNLVHGSLPEYSSADANIPDGTGKGNWLRPREASKKDIDEIARAQETILQEEVSITEIMIRIRQLRVRRHMQVKSSTKDAPEIVEAQIVPTEESGLFPEKSYKESDE